MAKFVRSIKGGLINLDHAAYGELRRGGMWALKTVDHETLGDVMESVIDGHIGTVGVVPAADGAAAVVVHIEDDGKPFVLRYPIVGWKISASGGAEPVLPEDTSDTVLIEMPDGSLLNPFGRLYQNLDEAIKDLVAEALQLAHVLTSTSEVL